MNLQAQIVNVPWLDNDDFRRYLYRMDLLWQPSFSETFNNVTAEGAAADVSSVVSDAIGWAPKNWRARADSATSIAAAGAALIRERFAADNGWRALDAHNNAAAEQWSGWLSPQGYDYFAWASFCR